MDWPGLQSDTEEIETQCVVHLEPTAFSADLLCTPTVPRLRSTPEINIAFISAFYTAVELHVRPQVKYDMCNPLYCVRILHNCHLSRFFTVTGLTWAIPSRSFFSKRVKKLCVLFFVPGLTRSKTVECRYRLGLNESHTKIRAIIQQVLYSITQMILNDWTDWQSKQQI